VGPRLCVLSQFDNKMRRRRRLRGVGDGLRKTSVDTDVLTTMLLLLCLKAPSGPAVSYPTRACASWNNYQLGYAGFVENLVEIRRNFCRSDWECGCLEILS
jgi:hypothetical protein